MIKVKNLQWDHQKKITEEKQQDQDFKAWYNQLRQTVFNNGPISKTFLKQGTDKRTREIQFKDSDLKI